MEDQNDKPAPDRSARRRRRITDAARLLFVTNGFHATGVAQIARMSGIAVGQIYRDFEAKEDIVLAIVEDDCAALLGQVTLRHAIAAIDTDAVWNWIRQLIGPTIISGTEALLAEIVAESARNARIAAILTRTQHDLSRDTRDALALLAPGDHLATRRDLLAEFVLSQSLGLLQHRLLRPDADITRLVDLAIRMTAHELDEMRQAEDRRSVPTPA